MTLALKGISGERARRRGPVARPHKHRVGRVPEMRNRGIRSHLMTAATDAIPRGRGQPQPRRGEGIGKGLEGDGRETIRQAEQRGHDAAERVAREPHGGVRVVRGDVVVDVPGGVVVVGFCGEGVGQAGRVAGVGSGGFAGADALPSVGAALAAAAASEEVVVGLVFGCWVCVAAEEGQCC